MNLNLTPPSDIEALIAGALGNILAHRRVVENARLVVTARDPVQTDDSVTQVIDVAIIPKGKHKRWYSPRYDAKFTSWLITWRIDTGNLADLSIADISAIADDINRQVSKEVLG